MGAASPPSRRVRGTRSKTLIKAEPRKLVSIRVRRRYAFGARENDGRRGRHGLVIADKPAGFFRLLVPLEVVRPEETDRPIPQLRRMTFPIATWTMMPIGRHFKGHFKGMKRAVFSGYKADWDPPLLSVTLNAQLARSIWYCRANRASI